MWPLTFSIFCCVCCYFNHAAALLDTAAAVDAADAAAVAGDVAAANASLQYLQGARTRTQDSATADRCAINKLHSHLRATLTPHLQYCI